MDGVGGYAGWRWIFILEGLLTVVIALIAPFAIHDSPETASFLTEEERRYVIHCLRTQNSADNREMVLDQAKFRMKYVWDAFTDWQIYLGLFSTCHDYVCYWRSQLIGISVLGDYLPSLWHLSLPPFHHQGSGLLVINRTAADRGSTRSHFE